MGNKKLHLRVWALFTYKYEIYFHKGYVTTSNHNYDIDNIDLNAHLTNMDGECDVCTYEELNAYLDSKEGRD